LRLKEFIATAMFGQAAPLRAGDFNTPDATGATMPEDSDRADALLSADRGGDIARGRRGHRPHAEHSAGYLDFRR
jgi:hypothetical protein